MDPYAELLNRQWQLVPPPEAVHQLERHVMAHLDDPPPARHWPLAAAATLLCGILALFGVRQWAPPAATPTVKLDFVESVMILENHTCIWLEQAALPPGSASVRE